MIRRLFATGLLAALFAVPAPAQDAAPVTAEEAVNAAREAYGPPDPAQKKACPTAPAGGEIVVCGETEDPAKYRVQSSSDLDPTGKGAQGPPRAPDLFNLPQPAMVGVGVSVKGCFIPPCPARMPLLIDLKALPEAPPGSDADRLANGLAPRGGQGEPAPPEDVLGLPPPLAQEAPAAGSEAPVSPPGSAAPAAVPSG